MLRRLARLLAPAAGCLEGEAASLWLQQQRSYASTVGGGGGSDAFESDTNLVQQPPAAAGRRLGPTSELGQPQEFGREEALEMVDAAPGLLCIRSFVWRIALAAMRLHGVADVAAVMQNNGNAATKNWLAVPRLMNRLALQHSLQLSPAQVYEQHAGYMANTGAERLIARLRFLEHSGMPLQQLLLQGEQAVQARQQECGLPLIGEAEGEPKAISLRDLCVLPDAQFASLPAVQAAGGLPVLRAFQAALKSAPGWLELQAAAEVEQAQLLPQLPASLRLAAEERQQRGRRHGRWRKSRAQVEQ
ncbi:hypothetical protein ABPG75_009994 [Micractinium tetrahymenae]